jgi:sterol desaturase/sphingolipid hydroxylase (fatty acid hydroxylase superfamily)
MILAILAISLFSNLAGLGYTYLLLRHRGLYSLRLQPHVLTVQQFHRRLPLIAFNVVSVAALTGVGLRQNEHLFALEWQGLGAFAAQFLIVFFVDDLYFYFYHRLMHENRFLYRVIHRVHHQAYAPLPLEYLYVHPLEWMLGSLGIVLPLVGIVLALGEVNAYALLAYSTYRNLRELQIHSGLPSRLLGRIPMMGTTDHHDLHHARLRGNYAASLLLWDKLLGTELERGEVTGRRGRTAA